MRRSDIAWTLVCLLTPLTAQNVDLQTIDVNATVDVETVENIAGEELKSADTAQALFKRSANVYLVRRSGVANDIIVRGFKKDNLNVTIDGMKLYGACPNRMDPPVSHVLANTVEEIDIIQGPFSVEDFGVLGADVRIDTQEPSKTFHATFEGGVGSWGYRKAAFTISGGNDIVQVLLGASTESSNQYEDGDGKDFVGQIQREIDAGRVPAKVQYGPQYRDLDAYSKNTYTGKLVWNITDNQTLRLSYTANRSDDVLYPTSKMDALYDDSDLYDMTYTFENAGRYFKKLFIQAYRTQVEHPMSTKYRLMGAQNYMTHALETQTDGLRIRSEWQALGHRFAIGADYMLRNWDGGYYKNDRPLDEKFFHSIWDVDTRNVGVYLKDNVTYGMWKIEGGLRFDDTSIDSGNPIQPSNDYTAVTGYLYADYRLSETYELFGGIGRSMRVPDAKELYWISSPMKMPDGTIKALPIGTPDLDATYNNEIDAGIRAQFDDFAFNIKAFYSMLDDYIAYNASKKTNRYENVDATICGIALEGNYALSEIVGIDFALSFQRGSKDRPLSGQFGRNMPEIPPLKYLVGVEYYPTDRWMLRAEVLGADRWSRYDAENGEQPIDAYTVLNLKTNVEIGGGWELQAGIDNLFDRTYAVSNTYKDLILLPTLDPNAPIVLMNEPGRYVYANVRYRF